MTSPPARHPLLALVYQLLLGAASGFALGFFAWMAADRFADATQPLWPYIGAGVVVMTVAVRAMATRRAGQRWMHLLWIPVLLFAALMAMLIVALRNFE